MIRKVLFLKHNYIRGKQHDDLKDAEHNYIGGKNFADLK